MVNAAADLWSIPVTLLFMFAQFMLAIPFGTNAPGNHGYKEWPSSPANSRPNPQRHLGSSSLPSILQTLCTVHGSISATCWQRVSQKELCIFFFAKFFWDQPLSLFYKKSNTNRTLIASLIMQHVDLLFLMPQRSISKMLLLRNVTARKGKELARWKREILFFQSVFVLGFIRQCQAYCPRKCAGIYHAGHWADPTHNGNRPDQRQCHRKMLFFCLFFFK